MWWHGGPYLARLGFDGLWTGVATQASQQWALVGVAVVNKQVIVGALCLHEGEVQNNAVVVTRS